MFNDRDYGSCSSDARADPESLVSVGPSTGVDSHSKNSTSNSPNEPALNNTIWYNPLRSREYAKPFRYRIWDIFWRLIVIILCVQITLFAMSMIKVDWPNEFLNATDIKIHHVGLKQLTKEGADVRVQGEIAIDFNKLDHNSAKAKFLRSSAYLVHSLTFGASTSEMSFRNYSAEAVGRDNFIRAAVSHTPALDVLVRHNETTKFDIIVKITEFGSPTLFATIIHRILKQQEIEFQCLTNLPVRKSWLPLGTWPLSFKYVINPQTSIAREDVRLKEMSMERADKGGLHINAIINAVYNYSASGLIPKLYWDLHLPGCNDDEYLYVARASNHPLDVQPYTNNLLNVDSLIHTLPSGLNKKCSHSNHTLLDTAAQLYLSGESIDIMVQGSSYQHKDIPRWISNILPLLQIHVPFKRSSTDQKLIQELQFSKFVMKLPSPARNPLLKPKELPKLSAHIKATILPPTELNLTESLALAVTESRGLADLYSKSQKFAVVDIRDWMPCETSTSRSPDTGNLLYVVDFNLENAPMNVTDESVFSEVAKQIILTGSAPVTLKAQVDAGLYTPLGTFVFSDIHIEGETTVRA